MSKIRFGVLGCSRIAQKSVLPAIIDSELAQLAMVGSRSRDKAAEIAQQFNCNTCGSYEDVVNSPEVDVVYISLPPALHEELSIKAANAGKHVFCEKPAAISYASGKKMVEAARRNNVRLLEGLMFRYHPQNVKVKELIKNGDLGNLLKFEGSFGYAMPEKNSNSLNKELGGGCLHACGVYPVAASRMLFEEEPVSVFCRLKTDPESGVDIKADMVLEYASGKSAFASALFGSYYESTYSILGTKASVRMSRAYAVPKNIATKIFFDADDKVSEILVPPADHFKIMIDDFCGEILKGENSDKDYENDLLAQAKVLEAAKTSAKESRAVTIAEIQ